MFRFCSSVAVASALILAALSTPADAQYWQRQLVGKQCGRCGHDVSIASRVGDTCPNCHARWGSESDSVVGYSSGSYSPGGYQPPQPPMNPFWAMYQEAIRQRELRRQQRAAYWSEVRENQIAQREEHRARLIEQTEQWRDRDAPELRADRYLKAAQSAETAGNLKAAACYYCLIARALPETLAAGAAGTALSRLNGQ